MRRNNDIIVGIRSLYSVEGSRTRGLAAWRWRCDPGYCGRSRRERKQLYASFARSPVPRMREMFRYVYSGIGTGTRILLDGFRMSSLAARRSRGEIGLWARARNEYKQYYVSFVKNVRSAWGQTPVRSAHYRPHSSLMSLRRFAHGLCKVIVGGTGADFCPFADVRVQPIDIPVQTADVPVQTADVADERAKDSCIRNALLISIFELGKNSPGKLQSIFEKRLRASCAFYRSVLMYRKVASKNGYSKANLV